MSRNTSTGVYTAPSNSVNPAVDGTIISAADFNSLRDDMASALAHATSTTRALYPTTAQVQDGALLWAGTSAGTSTAATATLSPAITAYLTGLRVAFKVGTSCAENPTLSLNGLAGKKIYVPTLAGPLQATTGDLTAGQIAEVAYDAALDTAAGGWVIVAPALGWRPVATATVGASSVKEFALPAAYTTFVLEWEATPVAAAAPFIRLSNDSGVSYKSGAADYSYLGSLTNSAAAPAKLAATSTACLVGGTSTTTLGAGRVQLQQFSGFGSVSASTLDSTPSLNRYDGTFSLGFAGPITNIQFGFVGTTITSGVFTLLGRR